MRFTYSNSFDILNKLRDQEITIERAAELLNEVMHEPKDREINISEVENTRPQLNISEVQKVNLTPNDVLMVTIQNDGIDEPALRNLQEQLKKFFPNNKVALFAMGSEGYVKFTVASTQEPVVQSYCTDCDCGKKERIENE